MAINEQKLHEFMGKAVGDIGAAMSVGLTLIGEKLGLYRALAEHGPQSSKDLAKRTHTAERYVREWGYNQAAGGYINYDPKTHHFSIDEEQALALAHENSPVYLHGAFDIICSIIRDQAKLEKAFKTGEGIPWGDHDGCLFCGTERFFRPNYNANLLTSWLPALEGVEQKLRNGAVVADVGCGHGSSTIIMAKAFPKSKFIGFDFHTRSIDAAREAAKRAGCGNNIEFVAASSTDFTGSDYDLVTCFDCLHDMGDPIGASAHILSTLKKDGTWMIVEPFAGDSPEENLNPIGRVFYGASASICVPASIAFDGPALGAQAGEKVLTEVIKEGGFTKVRRVAETPFNIVLEARG